MRKRLLLALVFLALSASSFAGGGGTMAMVMGSPPVAASGAWFYASPSGDSWDNTLTPTVGRHYGGQISSITGTQVTKIGVKFNTINTTSHQFKIYIGTGTTTWTYVGDYGETQPGDTVVGWKDYTLASPVAASATMIVAVNFKETTTNVIDTLTSADRQYKILSYASSPENPTGTGYTWGAGVSPAVRLWAE